jgi:hypothetical protein
MVESEGKVYIYSTGGGGKSSPDGLVWTNLPMAPPWNRNLLPNNGGLWAPDGIFFNGQFLLYGSLWAENNKSSVIVLMTSPTLNPSSPNYRWTDRGVAISGPAGVTHSVIDAGPVIDAEGNLWVVWGGGYPFPDAVNSIFVTRMDNGTGLPLTSDPGYEPPNSPGYPLKQGHKEGPYIHYRNGYYYLFWQTGNCCGTNNPYVMHVDRSQSIKGPFTGDRTFYASRGNIYGPGHMGIYSACGFERFTYHYYPPTGNSVIGENELEWDADGWPVVGAESTTPLVPCGSTGGGGMGGGAGSSGGRGGTAGGGVAGMIAGGGVGGLSGGGGSGNAGNPNGGSSSAGAPASGGAGATATGGYGGATATGGNTTTGGIAGTAQATGGTTLTGGAAGSTVDPEAPQTSEPGSEADCSCRVPGRRDSNDIRALLMLGAALGVACFARWQASARLPPPP